MSSLRIEITATVEIPVEGNQPPQLALAKALELGAEHPETLVTRPGASVAVHGEIVGDDEPTSWPREFARRFRDAMVLRDG